MGLPTKKQGEFLSCRPFSNLRITRFCTRPITFRGRLFHHHKGVAAAFHNALKRRLLLPGDAAAIGEEGFDLFLRIYQMIEPNSTIFSTVCLVQEVAALRNNVILGRGGRG